MIRPLPNDFSGCTRSDCDRSPQCWRYEGAIVRKSDRAVFTYVSDPATCNLFLPIQLNGEPEECA